MTITVTENIDFDPYGKVDVERVDVGFFESARYDKPSEGWGSPEDNLPVAEVAFRNEFGTPTMRIPERPFFRQAIELIKKELPSALAPLVAANKFGIDDELANKAGLFAEGKIKKRIVELRNPPNAPLTIKLKGFDNPLIETSLMLNSVTYMIYGKNDE